MPNYDSISATVTYTSHAIAAQKARPVCFIPPSCTLIQSGSTIVTNVTVRGANDGKIKVAVSGYSGTTADIKFYINGALKKTGGDTYTFTGLAADYYDIEVVQGICYVQVLNVQVLDGEFRTGNLTVYTPTALSASENPIILSLSTAKNPNGGLLGKSYFRITGTINDGNYVEIHLTYPQEYTARFTAKNFPNRDDSFLATTLKDNNGVTVGTNTTTEIATSLCECFQKDLVLSRLYDFRPSTTTVYCTAKQPNGLLNLNLTDTVTKSGNITLTETVVGSAAYDGQMIQNYSLYTDVLINPSAQYGTSPTIDKFYKVAQLELPFQSNNVHYFDVANVLKNYVFTPKIDFSVTGFTTLANMMSCYRLQYGEKYPLIPNQPTKKSRVKGTSDALYLINSSLPWEDENNMIDYTGSIVGNLNNNFTYSGVTYAAGGHSTFTISNYLIDPTDTGTTTDIKFRINDYDSLDGVHWNEAGWRPWQSSPYFAECGANYSQMQVSGMTDGIPVTYTATYILAPSYGGTQALNTPLRNGLKFLTTAPTPKQVQRYSSEYLYVILPRDYGREINITADLYFYDGTVLTGETLYTITTGTTNWGGVFALAAGYNELNLSQYEVLTGGSTRKIRRVDFAIYQNNGGQFIPLTEIRSYRYNIDEMPRRYGVAFLQSKGCWDIFDFSGEIVDSINHENEKMEVPRQISVRGNSPLGFQANTVYATKVLKKHACNTGWIDEAHFNWLIELMASNRIYNYTDEAQPFITIDSVGYSKSSNDDLYSIDVVFTETLIENNIST